MLLNYAESAEANSQVVVLLHGLVATSSYWESLSPYLSKNYRIIAFDLLGFGYSPAPKNVTYNYETHIASILETLDHLKIKQPVTIVGHSMGASLALKLAVKQPKRVNKLVLISLPIFLSAKAARKYVVRGSRFRKLMLYGPTSRVVCSVWCRALRPISRRVAPLYLKHLPKHVARDTVLHTWRAYSQSLANIVEQGIKAEDLSQVKCPAILIYGKADTPEALTKFKAVLRRPTYQIHRLEGGHQLPCTQPEAIAKLI